MSEPLWFLIRQGQQYGPMPQAKLQAMAAQGQIAPTDLLRQADRQDWQRADQVENLTFGAAPPATAPGPTAAPTGKAARKRPLSKKQGLMILVLAVLNAAALAAVVYLALRLSHFKPPPLDTDAATSQPAVTQPAARQSSDLVI